MKKKRFTESQIISILKDGDKGIPVQEICRKHGIVNSTYYAWRAKYSGMNVSELKRLKELEEENCKLKQMYADLSLEHAVLKDVIEKNFNASSKKRAGNCNCKSLRA